MSTNIDLKNLWNRQEISMPDTEDFHEKANQFKRKSLRKLIIANLTLLVTTIFLVFVWYTFQPEMITTKIGIVLIILAIVSLTTAHNKSILLLKKVDFDMNNSQYLHQLLTLKAKQSFLHKTMLTIYFILLSAGICLYMIEYCIRMTLFWAAFSYGITLLWIAINWFYFRPRTIKNREAKLNELIDKFEALRRQLTDK